MDTWVEKYQPQSSSQIQGQDKAVTALKEFISTYSKQRKRAALIYGSPGCGKTSSAYAIAKELDLEVVEVNASDFRNKDNIKEVVGGAMGQMSLFSRGKLILMDEVDGLSGTYDRGGIAEITRLMESSKFPVVLTANDPFDKKFSTLRSKCEMIEFHTLNYLSITKILKGICDKEGVSYDEDSIKALARKCAGDLRAAINDLQILCEATKKLSMEGIDSLGHRDQTQSVLDALTKIFKSKSPEFVLGAFENIDEDIDKQFLWLEENIPHEYKDADDLYRAFDAMSKANIFYSKIKRWQHWRFLVYVNAMMTAGVALAKKEKYKGFTSYKLGDRILKIWMANQKNAKRKDISKRLALYTHTSSKYVYHNTLHFFKYLIKTKQFDKEFLINQMEFSKEEVAWLTK